MIQKMLIAFIRAYQTVISPYIGQNCRFYPSCSEYSILVIKKDGALKGIAKSIGRIVRCNPLSKGGIDFP